MQRCTLHGSQISLLFGMTLVGLGLRIVRTCSPSDDEYSHTLAEKAHSYDVILYGKVLGTYSDPRFDYGGGSDVYTAKFKVYCIYKGGPLPPVVNISEAGVVPGHCHATNLQIMVEYIVMIHQHESVLKIHLEAEATPANLRNITRACGLMRTYPHGVDKNTLPSTCPEPASSSSCVHNPRGGSQTNDATHTEEQEQEAAVDSAEDHGREPKEGDQGYKHNHDTQEQNEHNDNDHKNADFDSATPEVKAVISNDHNNGQQYTHVSWALFLFHFLIIVTLL